MTEIQHNKLLTILEELEWDYGYAPSFNINSDLDISECRNLIFEDFKKIKIELNFSEELVESKNNIIGRLNAI